jgi:hypothetical protein
MTVRQVSSPTLTASSIELCTSTNITVTCLHSPCGAGCGSAGGAAAASAWPQPWQNRCAAGFAVPHATHSTVEPSAVPQSPQNRAASGFSVPHFGQVIRPRAIGYRRIRNATRTGASLRPSAFGVIVAR